MTERVGNPIRKVAVFAKPHPGAGAILQRIAACLARHGIALLPDDATARALKLGAPLEREDAVRDADLVISVGGDGTLLASARAIDGRATPLLGINMGTLGFLTETGCDEVDRVLDSTLAGTAPIETRSLLEVSLEDRQPSRTGRALNDVVISQSSMSRLISLALFVDREWVANYRADGMILATPTGSTAYSLSAGGPVVSPAVDALLITPICPHSLSQRPLLLPGWSRVTVALDEGRAPADVRVTLDGQSHFALEPGEKLHVGRAAEPLRLVRPPGQTFFATLRSKLGWGHP